MKDDEISYEEIVRRRDSKLYNFGLRLKSLEQKIKTEAPIVAGQIKQGIETTARTSAEAEAKMMEEYNALKEEYRKLHEWAIKDSHDKSKIGAITGDNPTEATEESKRNPFAIFNNEKPFNLYTNPVGFGWDKNKFPTFTDSERLQTFNKKMEIFSDKADDSKYGKEDGEKI